MTEKTMSPEEAAARRRLHDAREEERVLGEQAWQLASPPFAAGIIAPVFVPGGWRMPCFVIGMALALGIWIWFKIRAGRAARIAEGAEAELAAMGAPVEPGESEVGTM